MRVHVVSDVHGNSRDLARAGEGADALVCLGDLVLFLDYADHSRGIFPDLFGAENASRLVELRTARRFGEARELAARLWAGVLGGAGEAAGADGDGAHDGADGDGAGDNGADGGGADGGGEERRRAERHRVTEEAVRKQYAELFAAFPRPTYATYGNVDVPRLWPEYARPGTTVLDGQRAEIGGRVFGFVGGGLRTPMRTPYEIDDETYAEKVAALGEVDVLCSHIPPEVPELCYDTVARRFERGSSALLEAIRAARPRYALFGHVHQPLARRMRIGATECVNVGHFAAHGTPWVLEW